MDFEFDSGREMWATLALVGGLGFMFIYGAFRREHTRVWPILMLGVVLDIATQVWFAAADGSGPGLYSGLVLFPLYCMVATVAGIMTRVAVEWVITSGRPKRSVVTR